MSAHAVEQLRFVAVDQDDPLAEPLLAELALEYAIDTAPPSRRWPSGCAPIRPTSSPRPAARMLIGLHDGQPVTGGAFRRFDAETAELKRIWTDSRYRRRGYAKALLVELEKEIAARGYRRVYLTTGDRQPEAEELYLTTGYRRLDEPLPAEGEVYPLAFLKTLVP